MKYIITALLSAALILLLPGTPVNNSTPASTRVRTVQAVAPEKATEVKSPAPTEQKTVVEPVQPQIKVVAKPISTNCADYSGLVSQYDWDVRTALAIMRAESGCDPNATNRANYNGTVDRGLFQVNSIHSAKVNGNLDSLYNASTNVSVAYRIYLGSGWRAWSVYNNGRYLQFL